MTSVSVRTDLRNIVVLSMSGLHLTWSWRKTRRGNGGKVQRPCQVEEREGVQHPKTTLCASAPHLKATPVCHKQLWFAITDANTYASNKHESSGNHDLMSCREEVWWNTLMNTILPLWTEPHRACMSVNISMIKSGVCPSVWRFFTLYDLSTARFGFGALWGHVACSAYS